MADVMSVTEIESRYDLSEEFASFFWHQPPFPHQVVKQFSTTHMFEKEVPELDSVYELKIAFLTSIFYFHRRHTDGVRVDVRSAS